LKQHYLYASSWKACCTCRMAARAASPSVCCLKWFMGPWISYSVQYRVTTLGVQLEGLLHLQDGCPRGVALRLLPEVVHGPVNQLRHYTTRHLIHHLCTHMQETTIMPCNKKKSNQPSSYVRKSRECQSAPQKPINTA
jgi:hypothetical protein